MTTPRRVFLSYTSELRKYPEGRFFVHAAEEAVAEAQDAAMDMACFDLRDLKSLVYCEGRVRDCDICVGIIGFRYGTPVTDRSELSCTELEYETATSEGKTRLIFLLDEDADKLDGARRLEMNRSKLQIGALLA